MQLTAKSALLREAIASTGSLLVAYSGGTDSAYLAYTAHRVLGERMLAVIADSASLPRKELADALAFTAEYGIPTHILQTKELERPEYARNDAQRRYVSGRAGGRGRAAGGVGGGGCCARLGRKPDG